MAEKLPDKFTWEEADVEFGQNEPLTDEEEALARAFSVALGWEQKQLGPAACVCPSCGHEQEKERGIPCRSVDCPECGAKMEGKVKAAKIIPTRSQDPIPAVPEEVEVTDADVQAALAWFDEAFPDLKGMLDAEVEGRVDYG